MAFPALTARFHRPVMGWSALVKADLIALSKSWVLRGWILALVLWQFFGLTGMLLANRLIPLPASDVLMPHLAAYLLVWSAVIIVLSAGSVSLESDVIADGILCRACTRTQYILAKLASRAATILGIYFLFAGVAAYCAWRYAPRDITLATTLTAIAIVGMAILLLVSLGVAMSVVFNNTIFSVIGMMLLWYVAAPVFNFLGAEYLSPASLQSNLPRILRDAQAPQVVQGEATPTSLTVTFSEAVDAGAAENVENYVVEGPEREVYAPGAATYDAARTRVILGGLDLPAGRTVSVRVRGIADSAGNSISPAADSASAVVASGGTGRAGDAAAPAARGGGGDRRSSRNRSRAREREPLRVAACTATASSLKVLFSREADPAQAEQVDNYIVESPPGVVHAALAATYSVQDRTTLLSGLQLSAGTPVKVTVLNVRDTQGNPIAAHRNSAVYADVTTWKYLLGFAVPAGLFALLAVAWFSRRDL